VTDPILRIQNLSVDYVVGAGTFHSVRDVSLEMTPGRVLGIVGETGCGKSTLAHAIPRLLPEPPAKIVAGSIVLQGTDLLQIPKWKLPLIRGTGIGMIFQEPINSLNPSYRIYDQLAEAVRIRRLRELGASVAPSADLQPVDYSRSKPPKAAEVLSHVVVPSTRLGGKRRPSRVGDDEVRGAVLEYLKLVRINDPETILQLYPHELSGGMRQRVMIAMALSGKPTLLIADEPTSALDITIQAQVLTLMKELMTEVKTSILFISHDLGVIAEMADEIGVMYAGSIVEMGPVDEVFENPRHPYTKALLRSAPNKYKGDGPLPSLPGSVPNLSSLPLGCPFHPRCILARDVCRVDPGPRLAPPKDAPASTHRAACYFSDEVAGLP
jgi:peptide/nickel transport system ATP-binding protein